MFTYISLLFQLKAPRNNDIFITILISTCAWPSPIKDNRALWINDDVIIRVEYIYKINPEVFIVPKSKKMLKHTHTQ